MSAEMLNEQTWAAPQVRAAYAERAGRMTVNGVIVKAMLLLAIVFALAGVGWHYAPQFLSVTSSLWFLVGYFVLIGLTLMGAPFDFFAMLGLLSLAGVNPRTVVQKTDGRPMMFVDEAQPIRELLA